MKLVHMSDLHLGHRAFQGGRPGPNAREADVADAFGRAVERTIALEPAAVLIAGDVFDAPEPPHSASLTLARGLERLRESLPGVHVCLVAGSRDTPWSFEDPGALAALDTLPGVYASTTEVREIAVSDELSIVMVPHRAASGDRLPEIHPDPAARWNVLLAHGRMAGRESDALPIREEDWDYIALGHEHTWRQVRPRAFYAGSIEKVGPAPWTEVGTEKGFLSYDLEQRSASFHALRGRAVVSLAPLSFEPSRPARLQERVREVLEEVPGGIDGKIVRLRIQGLPSGQLGLIRNVLPEYRVRALHLEVQLEEIGADESSKEWTRDLVGRVARRLEDGEDALGDLTRIVEGYLQDPRVAAGGDE